MGQEYFQIVGLNHFWVVRRFEVLRKLFVHSLNPNMSYCEVGCGNGILQRQLELEAQISVDGIELCLPALQQNLSRLGTLYYYNVLDRHRILEHKYDSIFLFDVLEHIEQDATFLKACLFHLKPHGYLIVNVPARKELFSRYDTLAGHVRRYSFEDLVGLANALELEVRACTYWGLPLYPVLFVRRLLMKRFDESSAYEKGFVPPNAWANAALKMLSRLEIIPQRLLGTSIMAVLRNK